MGLSIDVRLPATNVGAHSVEQVADNTKEDAVGSTVLERCSVAANPTGVTVRHSSSPTPSSRPSHEHMHRLSGEASRQSSLSSLATMRQATGLHVSADTFSTLENSWRKTTRRQYQSVWKVWQQWCADQHLDPATISVERLLHYLQHLTNRGYAWRTINVHRSAVSSILEPHKTKPVGQDPLVCRFLKGVLNLRPPAARVVPTWDVGKVLTLLTGWHPPQDIGLPALTKKLAFLLAICSAKRISDLLLFSTEQSMCYVGDASIVLQANFGSKTDRSSHRSPPIRLKKCVDASLCPVLYLKTYLQRTSALRQETRQLFISPYSPHHAVKVATLRRWIVAVLTDAGITASAGSTRATATTCALLRDVPLQRIMASADWTRRTTPIRHYMRVLPEDTLRAIEDRQSVQDALLP